MSYKVELTFYSQLPKYIVFETSAIGNQEYRLVLFLYIWDPNNFSPLFPLIVRNRTFFKRFLSDLVSHNRFSFLKHDPEIFHLHTSNFDYCLESQFHWIFGGNLWSHRVCWCNKEWYQINLFKHFFPFIFSVSFLINPLSKLLSHITVCLITS